MVLSFKSILQIRVDSKDMIDSVFLSRDFPLAWLLDEYKDAFSRPGKRINSYFSLKKVCNASAGKPWDSTIWLNTCGAMKQKRARFWPPWFILMLNFNYNAKVSLTSSNDGEQRAPGWAGGKPAGADGSTDSRRAILAGSASWPSTWT